MRQIHFKILTLIIKRESFFVTILLKSLDTPISLSIQQNPIIFKKIIRLYPNRAKAQLGGAEVSKECTSKKYMQKCL